MAGKQADTGLYTDIEEHLFSELFREYEQRLFVFVVRILRSEDIARDIVQEVFLKLWSVRSKIAEIENINGFLYRLTENKVYDYLRHVAVEKKAREELWHRMTSSVEDHSQSMIEKEYHDIIEKAINNLPPQRRKVYILSKREGKKQLQIAKEMDISPNTVRNHLSEAFKQIGIFVRENMPSWLLF